MTCTYRGAARVGVLVAISISVAASIDAQTVTLVGADSAGALKFTAATRAATFQIPLELDKGTLTDFRIVVDDFVAPDNSRIPVTLMFDDRPAKDPRPLTEIDRPVVSITADFPIAGEYNSRVVLFHGAKRLPSVPLTVTRVLSPMSVRIDAVDARSSTVLLTADASLRVTIQETTGQQITIDRPTIVNLALKRGEKVQREARYGSLLVHRLNPDGTRPRVDCKRPDGTSITTVVPLGAAEFLLTICGLEEAGEYTGTIRVSNRDSAPIDKAITIYVKEHGAIAFFFIFLGVFASYLVRRWTKEERPRLEGQQRTEDLEAMLQKVQSSVGAVDATSAAVFAGIRVTLDDARKKVERGNLSAATALLDEAQRKIRDLPEWLNLGRQISVLEARGNVDTVRQHWVELSQNYFLSAGSKAEDFRSGVQALSNEIRDAQKDHVVRRVAEFRRRVDGEKAANSAIAPALDKDVIPLLVEAEAHAQAAKVSEADGALAKSKAAFAKSLANALRVTLSVPPPIGFTTDEWKAAHETIEKAADEVTKRADPNEAIEAYNEVHRSYLDEIVSAAERQIGKSRNDIAGSTTLNNDQKKALVAKLETAANALSTARALMSNGDYAAANAKYIEAADAIHTVMQGAHAGGAPLKAGAGGGVPAAVTGSAAVVAAAPPAPTVIPPVDSVPPKRRLPEQIQSLIARYDLVLNMGVLLIATLLGMKLLWADDPVWGGLTAYAIAFLWGLGLQQVGGAGFEGLPALTRKLTE